MSSIKKTLMKQGMKLMSDPRVMKIMQDERVMKAVMQMMSVPGKVQTFTDEQVEKLAKAMSLATEDEVNDLKRQIRRLEEEIARLETSRRREGLTRLRAARSGRALLDPRRHERPGRERRVAADEQVDVAERRRPVRLVLRAAALERRADARGRREVVVRARR